MHLKFTQLLSKEWSTLYGDEMIAREYCNVHGLWKS
ncbi:MAG: hypothetical protein KAT54_01595 [Candidatus Marinimicrobia bacterium]|nr:hypothetical protein [Candidatus Neomarinimicrobiota bacterium]